MQKILLFLSFISTLNTLYGYEVKETLKEISPHTQEITLTFTLKPQEYLYKESITPSVNNPDVTLSSFKANREPVSFFDETYKKQKDGYTGVVTFTTIATIKDKASHPEALVHTHFMVSSDKQPKEKTVALYFSLPQQAQTSSETATKGAKKAGPASAPECEPTQPSLVGNLVRKVLNYISVTITHAQATVSSLFTQTGSRSIRMLAALFLGLMLSLTPCIYPMIPITIGVLQASGTTSGLQNFLLALFYTLGISLTFATLGFIAALGSCVFGELQGSPYILLPLSALLFYFGLIMFDLFQMPIPSWLQARESKVKGGSKRSAFIFGALSGTVASPCLSPGLILILNYVAHISAISITGYLEGFALLFIFGVGSSLPLLIIGTFSGSLSMLPKAGAWMIEIKKLVGIMLISMALYHLSHLERMFPWHIFVWITVATFIALGIYYFVTIKPYDSRGIRRYKNIMGTLLVVVACIMAVQGQKAVIEHFVTEKSPDKVMASSLHDYTAARSQAVADNKLLLIDLGATYCAACKALDARIFKQEALQDTLSRMTLLKIEADIQVESYEQIKKLYGKDIMGYPTYLLVDPVKESVIKKWSIDIDELSLDGVAEAFDALIKQHSPKLQANSAP